MAQDQGDLDAGRRLARPEDHRHRLAGGRLVDVDRQEAAAVIVSMEQRELLAAVDPVLGVVDVEHDAAGHGVEAVAEQLDHGGHHALERGRPGQVLEPAHGRLRAQLRAALGQPADRHLEGRIGAQGIAVVGILVAGCDQQATEADHLGEPVPDPLGRPRVLEAAGQALSDAEMAFDLGQQQHATVRGQPSGIEGELHGLAGNG